jgi:hypothetical protein
MSMRVAALAMPFDSQITTACNATSVEMSDGAMAIDAVE